MATPSVVLSKVGSKCKVIIDGDADILYPNLSDVYLAYYEDNTIGVIIYNGDGSKNSLYPIAIANVTIGGVVITSKAVFDTQVEAVFPEANGGSGGSAFADITGEAGDNTSLSTALAAKLPLAGGTMTGNLLFTDNTLDIGASGATRPRTGYFGTSIFNPLDIGGTGTTSTKTIRATSGVGTTGADIIFQVGNNGATEALRILNNGNVGIGVTSTSFNSRLQVKGSSASPGNGLLFTTNTFSAGSAGSVICIGHGASSGDTYATIEGLISGGNTAGNLILQPTSPGKVGIGVTSPTAVFHLKAGTGTTGTAAMKFEPGTRTTVAVAGQLEYETNLFILTGGLIAGTDATYDIGANLVNRFRDLYLSRSIVMGGDIGFGAGGTLYFIGRSEFKSPSNGVITLLDTAETSFGRLQFGGTTSSFPALKRSTTSLQVRLADDSADADLSAARITSSTLVVLKGYTVATLPAGVVGATAYVTDALTPTFLVAVVGGGSVVTTVFYNGTTWVSQ